MVYEFVMPVPLPWGWIITGGVVLAFLIAMAIVLIKVLRRAGNKTGD